MAKLANTKNIIHINQGLAEVQSFSVDTPENELHDELKAFFSEFTNYDVKTNTINGEDVDRLIECVLDEGFYNYDDNCYIFVTDCLPNKNLLGRGQTVIY